MNSSPENEDVSDTVSGSWSANAAIHNNSQMWCRGTHRFPQHRRSPSFQLLPSPRSAEGAFASDWSLPAVHPLRQLQHLQHIRLRCLLAQLSLVHIFQARLSPSRSSSLSWISEQPDMRRCWRAATSNKGVINRDCSVGIP